MPNAVHFIYYHNVYFWQYKWCHKNIDSWQAKGVNYLSDVQKLTMGYLTGTRLLITRYKKQKAKCCALLRAMNQSQKLSFEPGKISHEGGVCKAQFRLVWLAKESSDQNWKCRSTNHRLVSPAEFTHVYDRQQHNRQQHRSWIPVECSSLKGSSDHQGEPPRLIGKKRRQII